MLDGAAAAADNGGVAAAAPSLQAVGGVMAKEKGSSVRVCVLGSVCSAGLIWCPDS